MLLKVAYSTPFSLRESRNRPTRPNCSASRWAAKEVNAVAVRADDLEHNGEIIEEIKKAIAEYDVIVADTTGANPNVCYEVGYAHALQRPTVLICRDSERLPFDLKGTNHLMCANILSLRDPLKVKLAAALNGSQM